MNSQDVVVDAFTDLAPSYEAVMDRELRRFWGVSYPEFIERVLRLASVGEGDHVLDLATGTARIPRRLAEQDTACGRVVGLDITPAMLQNARRNEGTPEASACTLVCASAMAIPCVAGAFDVVICGLGTHHMDVPQMLSEVCRALRAGGRLVLVDVGASAFWRSFLGRVLLQVLLLEYRITDRSRRAQAEQDAFPNVRTADEWQALLFDAGFSRVEIDESPARRRWYPCALSIRAAVGDS